MDGVPIADFLTARTVKMAIEPKPSGVDGVYQAGGATAAPISADGYMLTAAHVLGETPIFVQLPGSNVAHDLRVVWNGFDEVDEFDLALIHVTTHSTKWFEFAPDAALGDGLRVVSAGVSVPKLVFASGSLTEAFTPGDGIASIVRHSTPLRNGDSGGPLITLDGKLVAINYGSLNLPLGGQLVSKAMRPNLAWLNEIIERDRRNHDDDGNR